MPLTKEQLDAWFTYHPPTPEQSPKFGAIVDAAKACRAVVVTAVRQRAFTVITVACRTFAEAIEANAPDSADKTAAIRCVRIARMAFNAAMPPATGGVEDPNPEHLRRAFDNLYAAQWQACAAIACA